MRFHALLVLGAAAFAGASFAHHGWTSFDQDKPVYLSGTVKEVRWQNPHAEAIIEADVGKLPDDLSKRTVPAQQQSIDGASILAKAQPLANAKGAWELEFAPMSRMQAWGLQDAPKIGQRIEVIGYPLADSSKRVVRVEYLFTNGKSYAFRSGPAGSR